MNTNPAVTIGAAVAVRTDERNTRSAPSRGEASRARSEHPTSGMNSNQQTYVSESHEKNLASPQDEVEVQRESGNRIVIKYLDASGRLIFQVPTSQVLELNKAIEQALEHQAQTRQDAGIARAAQPGGLSNGH